MVVYTFNPSTWETEARFEENLVYRMISGQPGLDRNSILKNKNRQKV